MKIYTRSGDDGSTGLFGGPRVPKDHLRIDAYGTVDELNSVLGLARCSTAPRELDAALGRIQNELFVVGAHLATPPGSPLADRLPPFGGNLVTRLESEIDSAEAVLPPLAVFILPGGTELAGRLHLARTVCRRAERILVALYTDEATALPPAGPESAPPLAYLNRLSDWLFVHARLANHLANTPDVPWQKHDV